MEATIILDGNHSCKAFKGKGIQEIPAIEWKDTPLIMRQTKTALFLESD